MPVVKVDMWAGRDAETRKRIIEGVTKVFTDMGVPAEAVTVILAEHPKENWGTSGRPASEM